MIAPRAAARPRGHDDATSRASQTGAHEPHSGPEEHAPLAPTLGFRGLTPPPSFDRSSTTSSPRRAPEHAGSHARRDGAAEPGLARVHGADPRKAAVRLPEIGSFEALEVPENARMAGGEPPLFSLSGGRRAPSWSTPTMPAHGVGTPAWASACLQPAEGGGGVRFSWRRAPAPGCLGPFPSGSVLGNRAALRFETERRTGNRARARVRFCSASGSRTRRGLSRRAPGPREAARRRSGACRCWSSPPTCGARTSA